MSAFYRWVAAIVAAASLTAFSCWLSSAGIAIRSFESTSNSYFLQTSQTTLQLVAKSASFPTFTLLQDKRSALQAFHQETKQCISAIQSSSGLWTWVQCDCSNCRATANAQLLPSSTSPRLAMASTCGQPQVWSTLSGNLTAAGLESVVWGLSTTRDFVAAHPLPHSISFSASTIGLFLLNCPVLSSLVVFMFIVFIHLWRGQWSVELAVADASSVLRRGEVWRVFSAAFSHHSPIHFAMNTLSLCNLAFIEPLLGSYSFAMLTLCFVILVELLDAVWRAALSRSAGHEVQWTRPHLGFSGVLFAWMMFAAAQLESFCPIPFLPFCVPTLAVSGIRLNLGPLLLVALIQVLVPISSFIGHCAGVLVGIMLLVAGGSIWSFPAALAVALVGFAFAFQASTAGFTALQLQGRFASVSSVAQVAEQRELYATKLFWLKSAEVQPVDTTLRGVLVGSWVAAIACQLYTHCNIAAVSAAFGSCVLLVISVFGQADTGMDVDSSRHGSGEEAQSLMSPARNRRRTASSETASFKFGPVAFELLQGHMQWCLLLWAALGAACLFHALCSLMFSLLVFGQLTLQIFQPFAACNSVWRETGLVCVFEFATAAVSLALFQRAVAASVACGATAKNIGAAFASTNSTATR